MAASALRNALAAQATYEEHGTIQRGAFAVRAQANMTEFKALVEGVATAFSDFKAKNNAKVDGLAADVQDIQAAIDKMTVQIAGGVGPGYNADGSPSELGVEKQPIHASSGLRGGQISAHYHKRAQEAQSNHFGEHVRTDLADFMRGVAGLPCSDFVKASLSEGQDKAGGYAVPAIVMPTILDALADQSALLAAGASILPVGGAKSVTTAAIDTLPKPAWRLELGEVQESEPTFRAVNAVPKSLSTIVRVSRELLMDAEDLPRALVQAISQAYALEFDRAGLVGSGIDPEPLGLYGMAGVKKIQQAGAKFAYADILAAYQAQLEASAPAPTSVIMAPRTLVGLAGKVDTMGQPLNAPALLDGVARRTTNGVPVNLGDSADKSLAFVGSFNTLQFALREAFNIQRLSEAYAKTGEIAFLCHARVDVIANYPQAITVIEGVTG